MKVFIKLPAAEKMNVFSSCIFMHEPQKRHFNLKLQFVSSQTESPGRVVCACRRIRVIFVSEYQLTVATKKKKKQTNFAINISRKETRSCRGSVNITTGVKLRQINSEVGF